MSKDAAVREKDEEKLNKDWHEDERLPAKFELHHMAFFGNTQEI